MVSDGGAPTINKAADQNGYAISSVNDVRRIAGIVLCGGQSTRMGSPKDFLDIGGETLLQRTVRVTFEAVSSVVVVSRRKQALPALPGETLRAYDNIEGEGPLRGLHSGLICVPKNCDATLVVANDHPGLDAEFLRRLISRSSGEYDATIVHWPDGKVCPLPGVYRTTLVDCVARLLSEGKRSLRDLLHECTVLSLTADDFADVDPTMESMWNVNRPEEWERWRENHSRESA